jgi:hypothetical protein
MAQKPDDAIFPRPSRINLYPMAKRFPRQFVAENYLTSLNGSQMSDQRYTPTPSF